MGNPRGARAEGDSAVIALRSEPVYLHVQETPATVARALELLPAG
jgi:hypothetical protein